MKRRLIPAVLAALFAVAGTAYASGGMLPLGPASKASERAFLGYYDGHKDTYLVTDVSSRAQARALHVNYSRELAAAKRLPDQYFIDGPAAPGQLSVFGSEPGETTYNPLWDEVNVTWKPGVTPVLLVKDDQIKQLAKQGKLRMRDAHVVLNAPITSIGK